MIKVKERSDTDVYIRCNTKQEKQFVLGLFLEMRESARMGDKIIVKGRDGKELKLMKPPMPKEDVKPPFVEGVMQNEEENPTA